MEKELPAVRRVHRWEIQLLRWCFQDSTLRTQLLRFVDCLPSLIRSDQVAQHLIEYLPLKEKRRLPVPLRWGAAVLRTGLLPKGILAAATRHSAERIARFFIAGSIFEEAFASIRRLKGQGFEATVDLLGEATLSESEADRYTERYLKLIEQWKPSLGSVVHLSLKLSSLAFPFDPVDPEGTWVRIHPRLSAILRAASQAGGFVNVDMEQYHGRDLVLNLTQRILEEQFPHEQNVGIVLQAYLKDSEEVARRLLQWVAKRGVALTIRLVRGAYWDSEVILSQRENWPCPVYLKKVQTDASFDRLTDLLLEHHPYVRVAIATHNLRSIAYAIVKARELDVPQQRWEVQVLYGMGETIQRAVRSQGIPVRVYAPVGELLPGMAYLVRRILENTSQTSFLARNLLV